MWPNKNIISVTVSTSNNPSLSFFLYKQRVHKDELANQLFLRRAHADRRRLCLWTSFSSCRPKTSCEKFDSWTPVLRLSGTACEGAKREQYIPWMKSQVWHFLVGWMDDGYALLPLSTVYSRGPCYTQDGELTFICYSICVNNKQWSLCSESDPWSHRSRWVTSFHVVPVRTAAPNQGDDTVRDCFDIKIFDLGSY